MKKLSRLSQENNIMPGIIAMVLLALSAFSIPVYADGEGRGGGDKADIQRARNRSDLRKAIHKRMVEAYMLELKEKSPDKYQELLRLREESPEKFIQQMRETMQKRMGEREKGRHGGLDKQGDQEDGQSRQPDRPFDGTGRRPGMLPGGPDGPGGKMRKRFSGRFLEHLKEKRPEAFEHLQQLRKNNPEEARKEIKKLYGGFAYKHFLPDDNIPKLIQKLRSAKDDAARESAQTELKNALKEAYEQRLKGKEEYINQLDKKIEEMRKQIAEYRKRQEEMCNKRYQQILDDIENFKDKGERRPEERERPGAGKRNGDTGDKERGKLDFRKRGKTGSYFRGRR